MTVHHLHIGCPDDGVEVNVDLTDAEAEGVRKMIAAYEAACPPDDQYSGPWFSLDDPDRCYRGDVYRGDGRDRRVVGQRRPRDPACAAWWPEHAPAHVVAAAWD